MQKLQLKKNDYTGKLIVFEGTDGAGKTTMISMLAELLEGLHGQENVLVVKQPTDLSRKTKLFQKMMYSKKHEDVDYRAVQLLTMSDRIQHGFEVIEPALKAGKTVICDRYVYTSLANMLARGYEEETWFFEVSKNLIKPDIVFLAYVIPSIAIKRIKNRPEEKDRFLDEELLKKVAKQFKELSLTEKFMVLDTANDPNVSFSKIFNTLLKEDII